MPPTKPERIAKVMAAAGVCSRRDAERLIAEGRVTLNGKTLTTPATLVSDGDSIKLDGKLIAATSTIVRVWRYHKPKGLVTTHRDEAGRATVFDSLPKNMPRVLSVGRLDLNSEGLLLLTTSGALSRALELPKNALKRTYRVRVNGEPTDKHLHMMSRGVTIDGVRYQPFHIIVEGGKETGRNRWLTVTLTEGKNREIRKVFEYFKYPVSRLIRTAYGPCELRDLPVGEVAELQASTVQQLMKKLGVE